MKRTASPPIDGRLCRLVLESMSDTVLLTDDRGTITWVCPNVRVIFGRDEAEVAQMGRITALLGAEPVSAEELAAGTPICNRQLDLATPGGGARAVLVSVRPVEDSAHSRLWAFRDVTDLAAGALREHTLASSEADATRRYRRTPAMLHSIDADGRLVEVSDRWLEAFGYRREDVLGRRSVELLTDESRKRAESEHLPAFFRDGRADAVPYRMVTGGGEVRDVLLSAVAEYDERGRFARSLAVVTDVTERLRAEQARDATEQRLRASEQRLQALAVELTMAEERARREAAHALHDGLAQDLAFASMHAARLAASLEGDPESAAAARALRSLLDRCIAVTRDLTVELSPPVLDELGLAAALDWLAETRLAAHGIRSDVAVEPSAEDLPEEVRRFLFRAARELVGNVVKHARASAARIEIRRNGTRVQLAVEDDGVGLAGTPLRSGDTFGLYSVGERLKALGGEMSVRTGRSGGLSVVLELPTPIPATA